jgi:hypothetical protein
MSEVAAACRSKAAGSILEIDILLFIFNALIALGEPRQFVGGA